ncbi:MAG: hypothetical protein ACREJG_03085, partial [Candidatus Rokuibacteriota bacterium]
RGGCRPGTIRCYRWDAVLPPDDDVQRAVTEAVTGIIALDNTLVVAGHLGAWPAEVLVVEVEPAVHEFGETLSPALAAVLDEVCDLVVTLATEPGAASALPRLPLGGRVPASAETP